MTNSKTNYQPRSPETRPPEPDFFDDGIKEFKPKANIKIFIKRLWLKRKALAFTIVPILILGFGLLSPRKEPAPVQEFQERREVQSSAQIERQMEAAGRRLEPVKTQAASTRLVERAKKDLDTPITAFLYKEERIRERSAYRASRKREEPLGIPSGTKVPALLSNKIFSFNVAAPVIALVARDFVIAEKVVIPKDSKFLGEAGVIKSLDRINVTFDLLIFPDGREVRVRAMALSQDGSGGIKGKVKNHRDMKVLKAIGETLLGGATLFVGNRQTDDPYGLQDQLRMNAAQNLTNQARQDLRSINVEKSVTTEAFTPISVIILEAV